MKHPLDTVEIVNPTNIDFTEPTGKGNLQANKGEMISYGGHPYPIKAGEKKVFQRFLADHMTKHITDKVLKTDQYNDEDTRREWWNKIQVGTVTEFQPGTGDTEGAKVANDQQRIAQENEDRMAKLERELANLKGKKK